MFWTLLLTQITDFCSIITRCMLSLDGILDFARNGKKLLPLFAAQGYSSELAWYVRRLILLYVVIL